MDQTFRAEPFMIKPLRSRFSCEVLLCRNQPHLILKRKNRPTRATLASNVLIFSESTVGRRDSNFSLFNDIVGLDHLLDGLCLLDECRRFLHPNLIHAGRHCLDETAFVKIETLFLRLIITCHALITKDELFRLRVIQEFSVNGGRTLYGFAH